MSTQIPASGCGAVKLALPNDPDGVLASLPASTQEQYKGFTSPVTKSVWSNFKVNHPPPYKIALSFAQLNVPFQTAIWNELKDTLGKDPDIKFIPMSTGQSFNIPQQIQQVNSLIDQKPDLVIVEPLADAYGPAADRAGKLGIPTLSFEGITSSKYAINMASNIYASIAQSASRTVRQMGGKGNTLFIHGLGSTTIDQDAFAAYKDVLKSCPGVKSAGEIGGAFVPATAKAETLKFLATHPEAINGTIETGGMSTGVLSAFQQAGRPLPVIDDSAGIKGTLAYWINNKDTYTGVAAAQPPGRFAAALASVAKSIVEGRGVKVSTITQPYVTIAQDENLDKWADPKWKYDNADSAEGPPQVFFPEKFLDTLFTNPSK